MNRQKSIAVFAVIAAVAMTSIGLTGISATPLIVSSIPQSQEGIAILGHVEYTLRGDDNQIKAYIQGDNSVVDDGKDCVAGLMFGSPDAGGEFGICKDSTSKFNFIAIGNGTGTVDPFVDLKQMTNSTNAGCAGAGLESATGAGELARLPAEITVGAVADAGGSAGTQVILQTAVPFDFVTVNATLVNESGIFSGAQLGATGDPNVACTDAGNPGVDWNMFSIQRLNSDAGIAVTDGDSLSVKWTITIGGS